MTFTAVCLRHNSLTRAALFLMLLPFGTAFSQSDSGKPGGVPIYGAPDERTSPIAELGATDPVAPVAESQGAGGVKWYLIKTKSGVVGWIKQSASEHSKKLDHFFRSRPPEPSVSEPIPLVSSSSAPRGSITVGVSWLGRSAIVPVVLNQTQRGNLMLDTGATNTVISHKLAALLSLRPTRSGSVQTVGGVISVSVAHLKSLRVGDAEVTDLPVVVHDFSRDPRVEGLLGMDFLGRYQIGLDTQKHLLVLSPR